MQLALDFTTAGCAAKEAGMSKVLSHTPDDYKTAFKNAVLALPAGRLFTSDDILTAIGLPPNSVNAVGAIMSGLSKSGTVRHSSFTASTRESRHAAIIRIWEKI